MTSDANHLSAKHDVAILANHRSGDVSGPSPALLDSAHDDDASRSLLLVGALIVGSLAAGVSMLITAVLLKTLTDIRSSVAAIAWLTVGGAAGAGLAGWLSEPVIVHYAKKWARLRRSA